MITVKHLSAKHVSRQHQPLFSIKDKVEENLIQSLTANSKTPEDNQKRPVLLL